MMTAHSKWTCWCRLLAHVRLKQRLARLPMLRLPPLLLELEQEVALELELRAGCWTACWRRVGRRLELHQPCMGSMTVLPHCECPTCQLACGLCRPRMEHPRQQVTCCPWRLSQRPSQLRLQRLTKHLQHTRCGSPPWRSLACLSTPATCRYVKQARVYVCV